ncbi:MAG: trigger factor [Proteobacteria bacterium]|nr:trigger factor [Pseudomonadota bacterium]
MEYEVKVVSPVEREIKITVPAEEVNAALATTIALYKRGHQIKGFRQGKAPASVIESKYRKQIYGEATTDLINFQINQVIGELGLMPMSRIDVDGEEIVRDQDFAYSITFETAPEIDLPEYKGRSIEEEEAVIDENEIAKIEQRILQQNGKVEPLEDARAAKDGEIAVVSFGTYDADGNVVDGIKAESFDLPVGEGQSLPEFEELVKTLAPGESGETEIVFPEDFINANLSGRTLTMKAKVHAVKRRIVPEMSDEVAKTAGFDTAEALKTAIRESYVSQAQQLNKSKAQKDLLDSLVGELSFDLPPSMLEDRISRMVEDTEMRLDKQGKSLASLGKSLDDLKAEFHPTAVDSCRAELFLLAVAKNETLDVTPQEIDMSINQYAMKTGQPFHNLKQYYEENNLLVPLRDRLIADKAMEFIYENAEVTKISGAVADKKTAAEKSAAKAPAKKAPAKKAPAKKAAAKKAD